MLLLWNGAWHGFFAAHHLSFLQGLEVSACPTSMHRLTAKTIGEEEGLNWEMQAQQCARTEHWTADSAPIMWR